ncbi:MAG: arginase family protein [Armatimonadetes bacterium]|nr:arginase family protein [Armatimonadota bacterium]
MKDPVGVVNLPFTGIASFAKFPICDNLDTLNADVAVMGIPWDEGVGSVPGTRFGPRAIREYSTRLGFVKERGYYDVSTEREYLKGVTFADCGDADVLYLDVITSFDRATAMVRRIVERGALPVVLGGDHSVSFPAVRGMEAHGPIDIVHVDAHLDFNDSVGGVTLANGSPFKRASELPFVRRIIQIGIRGIRTRPATYFAARDHGNIIITMARIRREGLDPVWRAFEALGERCYLSIDTDGLDPSVAPGTGSPDPDGLQRWQVAEIVRELTKRSRIVGFDFVEVNPMVDPSGLTALVAATTIVETLGQIFAGR